MANSFHGIPIHIGNTRRIGELGEIMKKALGFEVGKTYYCGYWRKKHFIREIREHPIYPEIVSEWEDGHITIHSTTFDKRRDKLITP